MSNGLPSRASGSLPAHDASSVAYNRRKSMRAGSAPSSSNRSKFRTLP